MSPGDREGTGKQSTEGSIKGTVSSGRRRTRSERGVLSSGDCEIMLLN